MHLSITGRYVVFALQIVEHGRIVDYGAANHHLKEILAHPSSKWEDLKAAFQKPVFFKLRDEFFGRARYHELYSRMQLESEMHGHLFNPRHKIAFLSADIGKLNQLALDAMRQLSGDEQNPPEDPSSRLSVVRILRESGIQALRDQYYIRVIPHSRYPHIVHLSPTV